MWLTFKNEDPSPALLSVDTVHEIDESCEKTTESSSGCSGREEDGNSEIDLVTSVPLSKEERDSREETSLSDT